MYLLVAVALPTRDGGGGGGGGVAVDSTDLNSLCESCGPTGAKQQLQLITC